MRPPDQDAIEAALGSAIDSSAPVAGGDINDAQTCTLADGRQVFVKTNPDAAPTMFACEARGLEWLRAADALRIPRVLAASDPVGTARYLVLERIDAGPRGSGFDEVFGRGLAALHRMGAAQFGLDHANFLATLAQANESRDTWAVFFSEQRLEPLLRRAVDGGRAPPTWPRKFGQLFARMPQLAGPPEPPARLHGDLWSGNVMCDHVGAPVLVDPAVYGGHREIDLAMLRLFGAPSPRLFAAYNESFPLSPGHEERVDLYQLYPLLAHVLLFGGGYVGGVSAALGRYV